MEMSTKDLQRTVEVLMEFQLPNYTAPDFSSETFALAPAAAFREAPGDGVAPEGFHATSVFPEYFKLRSGRWALPERSRMDCVVVRGAGDSLAVREFRNLRKGDLVACGRSEDGSEGILVHTGGFAGPEVVREKFAFRTLTSRETSFSFDYDELYALLAHEREQGRIIWVMGPAAVFDRDARDGFVSLIRMGFVHGVLAGNALATHDVEGALLGTALGRDLYSKRDVPLGHYNHLDTLNTIRGGGGLHAAVREGVVRNGVMQSLIARGIPYVLAGSIRDDGPLPEVVPDVYQAQDRMRAMLGEATTVLCLATQLHTIAGGNMTSSYTVTGDGRIRPVYFYTVDMSEFAAGKLANRGSLTARSILTNVQDFLVTLERGLRAGRGC
jgi:hypothetical protein